MTNTSDAMSGILKFKSIFIGRNKISASISGAIGIVVAAGALSPGFVSADDHAETV